jgi:hypothetical protein
MVLHKALWAVLSPVIHTYSMLPPDLGRMVVAVKGVLMCPRGGVVGVVYQVPALVGAASPGGPFPTHLWHY